MTMDIIIRRFCFLMTKMKKGEGKIKIYVANVLLP